MPRRGRGHLAVGQRHPTPTLTLAEFSDRIGNFIVGHLPPADAPRTGVAPQHAWTRDGWLPRLPDSLEALDELLLTVPTARKVHRDGIRFQGLRYLGGAPPDIKRHEALAFIVELRKRQVTKQPGRARVSSVSQAISLPVAVTVG